MRQSLLIILSLSSLLANAAGDTTVVLKSVDIQGDRFGLLTGGRITDETDSITKSALSHQSLDLLLDCNSSMYVRNYGPGTLSSLTMRGGSSYHTAVLWNGFQIANPMNGQLDFSLLQNFFFDRLEIQRGGASALWGSGAVSGVINLHDNTHFNAGLSALLSASVNSMGNTREMAAVSFGNSKISLGLKFFTDHSPNKFDYLNNTIRTEQIHSLCNSSGALADIAYFTGNKSLLTVGVWMQSSNRQIGPVMTQVTTDASQSDESFRISSEWKIEFGKSLFAIRTAFMNDKIDYTDSLLDLPSNARDKHFVTEAEYHYEVGEHHLFLAGANFDHNTAVTNEYPKEISLDRTASYLSYRFTVPFLIFNTSIRQEFSSLNNPPLIYSGGATIFPLKGLTLLVSGGNVFRNPTINDLYWKPGGNINLLPEKGFTGESTLRIEPLLLLGIDAGKMKAALEGTYFSKNIDNWIAWIPTGSYWQPMNIKSVHSFGEELRIKLNYSGKKISTGINFDYSYTRSETMESIIAYDESIGKQLVYVPFDKFTAGFFFDFRSFRLSWWHLFTNFRFTTADNTSSLPAYHIDHLQLDKKITLKDYTLSIFGRVNNIFDTDYQAIENHPEPLRNFELGLSLKYSHIKN